MHKINVLSFGSKNFNTSLEELKDYLNFNLSTTDESFKNDIFDNYDVLFIHENFLKNHSTIKLITDANKIRILVHNSNNANPNIFDDKLLLPTFIKDINQVIENSVIKKNFNKNSMIKIKDYILDKNEKKLIKNGKFILLTEKEIQLLVMFLKTIKPITKNNILSEVWEYSVEADTHTVETHIYRLRKKIKDKFSDTEFILNNKSGYLL
jgi:hypothetical protein